MVYIDRMLSDLDVNEYLMQAPLKSLFSTDICIQ